MPITSSSEVLHLIDRRSSTNEVCEKLFAELKEESGGAGLWVGGSERTPYRGPCDACDTPALVLLCSAT